jgi:dimethylhistidine N-methyltransferase
MQISARERIITSAEPNDSASLNTSSTLFTRDFDFIDCKPQLSSFKEEVFSGLSAQPKVLEPKFFYDEEGSRLFEQICEVPEYYPTRTEMAILESNAREMRNAIGDNPLLIEFGSGNSQKIRLLLDQLKPAGYIAIEISREQLLLACDELSAIYPRLSITAICADYCQQILLPQLDSGSNARRTAFFPGSTIGNFAPAAAIRFLTNVRQTVGPSGGLLIGVDMKKDRKLLNAAYNDEAGVTAAFNVNLLRRMNSELGADFDLESFNHHAFYNDALGRIEMHLVSQCKQQVRIGDKVFRFAKGESIHTENSYKYTIDEFRSMAAQAGFGLGKTWVDKDSLFSVHYLAAV